MGLVSLGAEHLHDVEVALRFFGQGHGADDAPPASRGGHMPLTRGCEAPEAAHEGGPQLAVGNQPAPTTSRRSDLNVKFWSAPLHESYTRADTTCA